MLLSDWLNVGEGRKPQREVGGAIVMVDPRVLVVSWAPYWWRDIIGTQVAT